jgi:hypothetical protein
MCALALACAAALAPSASASAGSASAALAAPPVPVNGAGPNGSFTGTFAVDRFVNRGGRLFAVGTLAGEVTNTATGATRTVRRNVSLPVDVAQTTGTCEILNLVLGPLDLNLLGLRIQLNQVVLQITAEQGPGNLLGNLLCAIAGLLDGTGGGGSTGLLANLLNQVLAILG